MLLLFLHFFRPALIPNSVGEWLCDYNFIILRGGDCLTVLGHSSYCRICGPVNIVVQQYLREGKVHIGFYD